MTIGTELKPCPFCGSDQVSMSYSTSMQSSVPFTRFVECEDCASNGPVCDIIGDDKGAKVRAIAAWNTRTASSREDV